MTKEEFLEELKEKFTQNGSWFNFKTPEREIKVSRKGSVKVYHNYVFKVTENRVFFCIKDYCMGQSGSFMLRGDFNIELLSESKNVDELINKIIDANRISL